MTNLRWLADECIFGPVVKQLRQAGHDVVYAAETLQQTADTGLADLALSDGRLLLTEDKDFGEIIFRKKQRVPGIVLLRIPPEQSALMWPRLEAVVQRHGASLFGQYVVVTATGTRVRPLATPD